MKLGEAILTRDGLQARLELLRSRMLEDHFKGLEIYHLQESLQGLENKIRDLGIAISWTEHQVALSDLPLSAYRIRIEVLEDSSKFWEKINRERADALWESAQNDRKVLAAATWVVDLQVPKIAASKNAKTEEVEE